jgi:hypothetical protein
MTDAAAVPDVADGKLQTAQEVLKRILDACSIRRIVCVDDQYGRDGDDSRELIRQIGIARQTGRAIPQSIAEIFDITDNDAEIEIERQIGARWTDLDGAQHKRVLSDIAEAVKGVEGTRSLTALDILARLLEPFEFVPLSEDGWRDRQEELTQPDLLTTTLFLFDRSLGGVGKTDMGIDLANELAANHETARSGLLTATIGPDQELALWEKLPYPDRMVVISKSRLGDDPISVVPAVRRMLLNPWRLVLLAGLEQMVKEADEEALEQLRKLDIHSLEHLVFTTSSHEGIWEPDTLLRLHANRSRRYARKKARENAEIIKAVKAIRDLTITPQVMHGSEREAARTVMRDEWYEEGDHLNTLHLPLDLGDIFRANKNNGDPQYFILMSQACDLMVRSNGVRPNDLLEADVLRLEIELSDVSRPDRSRLDYWDEPPEGKDWFVCMRPVLRFSLDVLDLCTFDTEGRAVFSGQRQLEKDRIPPSWIERLDRLDKRFDKSLEGYRLVMTQAEQLDGEGKARLSSIARSQLPLLCSNEPKLCRATIEGPGESVTYGVSRVGRLSLPRAANLLAQFSAYNARGAFEHDLARFESDD